MRRHRQPSAVRAGSVFLVLAALVSPMEAAAIPGNLAVLQGLDKVTGRVSRFDAPLNHPVRFGTLRITVRSCDRTPPEEPPESVAFLEVVEARPGEHEIVVFSGWMFASSPALSALEHAVYDVWVLECKTAPAE